MELGWVDVLLRMGAAVVAGAAIGWDRQRTGRPAGLRTHMLVSLGTALFVLIPISNGSPDTTRVIQGVATGIGFLCAGDILHLHRGGTERVKGLTSAAALWVTAGVGMVAASGLWPLTVVGTTLTVLILTVLRRFEPEPEPEHKDHQPHDAKSGS